MSLSYNLFKLIQAMSYSYIQYNLEVFFGNYVAIISKIVLVLKIYGAHQDLNFEKKKKKIKFGPIFEKRHIALSVYLFFH